MIKELAMSCVDTGFIKVSTPPLTYPGLFDLPNESFRTVLNQGFVWHCRYAAFVPLDIKITSVRLRK